MSPADQPSFWKSPMTWVIVLILVAGIGGVALAIASGGSGDDDTIETAFAEALGDALPFYGDAPDPAVGTTAPVISAQTVGGDRVQLDADGTGRVYGFFAHWCPVCQDELPLIVDWLAETDLPADVEFVAVSTAVDSGRGNYPPSEWFAEEGFTGTVLLDSEESDLAQAYGLPAFPYFVAVDGDGTVTLRATGAIDQVGFDTLIASVS